MYFVQHWIASFLCCVQSTASGMILGDPTQKVCEMSIHVRFIDCPVNPIQDLPARAHPHVGPKEVYKACIIFLT